MSEVGFLIAYGILFVVTIYVVRHNSRRGWLLVRVLHEVRSRLPESLVKEIEEELK